MKIIIFAIVCCITRIDGIALKIEDCKSEVGLFCDNTDQCESKAVMICNGQQSFILDCKSNIIGEYCTFNGPAKLGMRPGNCTTEVPVDNGATSPIACPKKPDFICFHEGHMIDPANCHKYYFCEKDTVSPFNLKAISYNCPEGKVYNKHSRKCDLPYSELFCLTVACNRADGVLRLAFPLLSHQFWTMCVPDSPPKVLVGACPDGAEVDLTSIYLPPKCNYKCFGLGYFKNSQYPTKYFHCYLSGLKYVSKELDCEPGMTFKENLVWGAWFSGCEK